MNSTRQFRRAGPIIALLALAVWGCTDSPTQPRDGAIPIKPSFAAGGSIGVNLDQCANKPRTAVCTWQNGDLNGNNSVYAEGLVVPFRLSVDGLTVGTQYQIRINYDFTAGGHKAYDFLASHDATETVNICANGGGGVPLACPLAAVTPSAVTWTENSFPSNLPGAPNTNSVLGAIGFSGLTATQRQLRLYKGTIDNIGPVTHTTSNGTVITNYSELSGNSDGDILVTFTPQATSILFTWGGHLAQSPYWESANNPNGAGQVSGAPWHMRTQQLQTAAGTSAGNKNQDRSIQPSAIVEPPAITVTKTADAAVVSAGDQIGYTITVTNTGQGDALAFALTDPLPGGAGISWSILGGTTGNSGITCAISGSAPNQTLNCPTSGTATFPAGATLGVHVVSQTTSASCAVYNNTATASFTGGPSSAGPVSITVNCPDVTVAKTAANPSINAGAVASFTITVTNLGPGVAKSVTLNDPLPAGLSWAITGGTGAGSCTNPIVGNTLSCNFGDMAAGASFTVTVSATTAAANCGTLPNLATVAATNEPASAQGNNTASASIEVRCGDLHVFKTADAATVSAGDQIGFTITVTNTGTGDATGFVLTDALPTGGGLSWSIQSQSGPVTCAISGNTLRCPPSGTATFPAGGTLTVHVISPTSAANCGTVPNTVNVTSQNDGNPSAGDAVTVLCPDVTVLKTAANTPISAGDVASFTITVTNSGAGLAKNVTLNDPLPGGLSWAITGGTGAGSCVNPIVGNTLSCNFGDMIAGASLTVTVSATTAAANCGTLPNLATVAATNEANTGNNTANANIVVQCPDLIVAKTAANTPISAGDVAQFTMTVTNLGPGVAKGVTLSDPLPAGLSWAETPDLGDCQINGGTLNCSFGDLVAGDSRSVTVSATTAAANCGTLPNLVTVAGTNEAQEQTANNTANASIDVQCPTIRLDKTPDAGTVSAGTPIGFLLTVTNDGAGTANNVHIQDVLPTNAGLSWSIDGGTGSGSCSISGGTLTCDFATLASQASKTVHISSPTTAASCGVVNNHGVVTTSNDGSDDADASVTVLCPDLTVAKTAANSPINAGDVASFTITVTNSGPGVAKNVTLNDPLPGGLSWAETPNINECSIGSGVLSCNFGDLAAGASASVTVSATTTPANCGTLPNQATAAADNEANTGNNSGSATIVVNCPDVTVAKTAANTPIAAGATASFTMTVTNNGPGTAKGVTLSDPLPGGLAWAISGGTGAGSCVNPIVGNTLSCNFGDMANGASFTVTVSAPTTTANCGTLPNLATVAATNEAAAQQGNNTASASIVVTCPVGGKITPTATTCQNFRDGTASDLTEVLAGLKAGKINNVAPGVFFYYTQFQSPGGTFTVDIVQSNNGPTSPPWPNFDFKQDQVVLYDANCTKLTAQVTTAGGQAHVTITAAQGTTFIIGVKYETSTVVGQNVGPQGSPLPVTYTYETKIGATTLNNTDTVVLKKK